MVFRGGDVMSRKGHGWGPIGWPGRSPWAKAPQGHSREKSVHRHKEPWAEQDPPVPLDQDVSSPALQGLPPPLQPKGPSFCLTT